MRLQRGKRYVTRCGAVTSVLISSQIAVVAGALTESVADYFPFLALGVDRHDDGHPHVWTVQGDSDLPAIGEQPMDIVAEYMAYANEGPSYPSGPPSVKPKGKRR